jgi:HAE1 family hydrophobic/amphiphilic exporter-1
MKEMMEELINSDDSKLKPVLDLRKELASAINEFDTAYANVMANPTDVSAMEALGKVSIDLMDVMERLKTLMPNAGTTIPNAGTTTPNVGETEQNTEAPIIEEETGSNAGTTIPDLTMLPQLQTGAKQALTALDGMIVSQFAEVNKSGLMKIEKFDDIFGIPKALEKAIKQLDDGIKQMQDALIMLSEQKDMLGTATDTINLEAAKAAMEIGTAAGDLSVASKALEDAKTALEDAKEQALESADMEGILTIETLSGLIVAQNFDMPAGYAYDNDTQYLIRVGESVKSVNELENLVLMDMGMDSV